MKGLIRPLLLATVILLLVPSVVSAGEPASRYALELGAGGVRAYKSGFDAGDATGWAYSPLISFGYRIGPHSQLALTLLRFNHYFERKEALFSFGYGFTYKHFWPADWGSLGLWEPYLSYSILLNQVFVSGTDGREVGHNSRFALGSDLRLAPGHRLYFEAVLDISDYPSLGRRESVALNTVGAYAGWRILF
jgi:hypothetical protein